MRLTVALVATVAALAGCADYSPVDAQLRDVRAQLAQVSTEVGQMKTSLDHATEATREAARKSAAARQTANMALTLAQADKDKLAHASEKLDSLDHSGRKAAHRAAKKGEEETPATQPPVESHDNK